MANDFASRLICWQQQHGRHDLPWQGMDAYRVWLSEIMLQQTQVATVVPYYLRFVETFPDIATLAAATEEQVLEHWSGLGYYARGRNLHRAARLIATQFNGRFPDRFADIVELPGVGRSTAAAICALAYHQSHAILDGNVKRVLARHRGIVGWAGDKKVEQRLWQQAEALLPEREVATYTQALMDLGATVCTRTRPQCGTCPVQGDCVAWQQQRIDELPSPRPRKAVPEMRAVMLLLQHDGDILLEKRAPQGIWGGLWSLPQFDDEEAARDWFVLNGLQGREGSRLEGFTHVFSHFRLHISPLLIWLAQKPLRAAQPGCIWMEKGDALGAAIPAPVRKILLGLSNS